MERIVVGVDGSQPAREALHWAVAEARRRNATVEAVYAWHQPFAVGYAELGELDNLAHFEKEAQETLDAEVDAVDASGIAPIERRLVPGGAAGALVEEARGASLLVVGSRGRGGFSGLLLGSVSQQVAHHAPCPIVIMPRPE
jgi:nucleotide-binding universal stress UspA family protein